jgi:hypothetical protein
MSQASIKYDTVQYFKISRQPDFREDVDRVRDNFNKERGFDNLDPSKSILNISDFDSLDLFSLYDVFEDDAYGLIKKYKLVGNCHRTILDDIILGADSSGSDDFSLGGAGIKSRDPDKTYSTVELFLYKDATLKDIKEMWSKIQEKLDELPGETVGRRRVPDKFYRDQRVYFLAKDGKTINEIYRVINKEFNEDMDFGAISNALSKFCRKMEVETPILKKGSD